MQHVLTIANQKGGVGKSTLAVHLAWYGMEHGRPVLLVDLDGQANSTRTFASEADSATLTASRLFTLEPDDLLPLQRIDDLSLIGADMAVNNVESLPLVTIERPAAILRALALTLPANVLILIDTPPTLGRRLLAALIASTAVVSPLALNGYSIQGITDLQKTIKTVRKRWNSKLRNLGLLPNMVNARSTTHQRLLNELRTAIPDKVLPYQIGDRIAIADAIDAGRPCWRGTSGSSGLAAGREMRAACKRIMEGLS